MGRAECLHRSRQLPCDTGSTRGQRRTAAKTASVERSGVCEQIGCWSLPKLLKISVLLLLLLLVYSKSNNGAGTGSLLCDVDSCCASVASLQLFIEKHGPDRRFAPRCRQMLCGRGQGHGAVCRSFDARLKDAMNVLRKELSDQIDRSEVRTRTADNNCQVSLADVDQLIGDVGRLVGSTIWKSGQLVSSRLNHRQTRAYMVTH